MPPSRFDQRVDRNVGHRQNVEGRRSFDRRAGGDADEPVQFRFRDITRKARLNGEHSLPGLLCLHGEHVARRDQSRRKLIANVAEMGIDASH